MLESSTSERSSDTGIRFGDPSDSSYELEPTSLQSSPCCLLHDGRVCRGAHLDSAVPVMIDIACTEECRA
eukprot:6180633-Pleurochrysis_carterae.AAC.3